MTISSLPDEFPRLAGLLRLYLGDPPVADELAQEALLRLYLALERGQHIEQPRAWLQRTAFNLARSWIRRRVAERRANARLGGRRQPDHEPPDTAGAIALRQAIAGLPARQRQALVLRYYADLDGPAIGAVMGITPATVRALIRRALLALRAVPELTLQEADRA